MFQLVTPCCRKPLGLKSLDEISAEEGAACPKCGHLFYTEDWDIEAERRAIYRASVDAVEEEFEDEVGKLREAHARRLAEIDDLYNPDLFRVFVVAKYGPVVSNHSISELETLAEAKAEFEGKCAAMLADGYLEMPDSERSEGMIDQRTFKSSFSDRIIRVGYWAQVIR